MSGFYEFFAGGGMVRAGLGPGWSCLFANDIDPKKAASYARNWGDAEFHLSDVSELTTVDLPGNPDLAFPTRRKVIFVHGCFWHQHHCSR